MESQHTLMFTLFRVQIFLPEQLPLLISLREPTEFLKAALLEKPTYNHPRGSWHIGNVTDIYPTGIYFAIGKQLPRQMGSIDDSGDFHTQDTLVAPNTHVLLDLHYQVLGIAKNSELAPESKSVARKLKKLLQETEVMTASQARVDISQIDDPTEFVELLQNSAAVTKFKVSFSMPNVWDADKDFQQPFQNTSREIGAKDAEAIFKADDLERAPLIKMTRASAAVGKRAKAWIKRKKQNKAVMVSPKENPATHATDAPPEGKSHLVRWASDSLLGLRKLYEEIRKHDE